MTSLFVFEYGLQGRNTIYQTEIGVEVFVAKIGLAGVYARGVGLWHDERRVVRVVYEQINRPIYRIGAARCAVIDHFGIERETCSVGIGRMQRANYRVVNLLWLQIEQENTNRIALAPIECHSSVGDVARFKTALLAACGIIQLGRVQRREGYGYVTILHERLLSGEIVR